MEENGVVEELKLDRAAWPAGPWDLEPDRAEFEHAGLPCLLVRNATGAWCGYAAVLPGHPFHGREYGECAASPQCEGEEYSPKHYFEGQARQYWHCDHRPDHILDAHGGLTYSGACSGHICHVPKPGAPDHVWWFGFDCNHASDVAPGMLALEEHMRERKIFAEGEGLYVPKWAEPIEKHAAAMSLLFPLSMYRTQLYVAAEVRRLAEQLAAAAG